MNRSFGINTKIYYNEVSSGGLEDYKFQWKRNGKDVPGRYYYKSTKTETTINMCEYVIDMYCLVSISGDVSSAIRTLIPGLVSSRN